MRIRYTVKKKSDSYPDLYEDWEYEIVHMGYCGYDLHVRIKNNPRRYLASEFDFFKNGKPIDAKDAYDAIRFMISMKKVGLEH